jgi:tetratricopeptide (TPR) repeat protein
MPKIHPKPDLARDLATRMSADERKLLRHAVGCPACRDLLLDLLDSDAGDGTLARVLAWPTGRDGRDTGRDSGHDYGVAIDCVIARTHGRLAGILREQAEAPALVDEILRQPAARREVLVRNRRSFWSLPVADQLLKASRERAYGDPEAGEELATLALAVVARVPLDVGLQLLSDTRARCHLAIGNARRIASDLRGAEEALVEAEHHLHEGSRDRLERARFYQYRASLRSAQRRFGEAASLLDRATAIYRRAGETHLAGEAIVARAFVEKELGSPERAIELLREAHRLIDTGLEPRLALCVQHNLIDWLTDAGRALEAQGLMAKSGEIYRRFDDPPLRLKRLWVQGKIARGLGQLEDAARLLARVREGWIELGIGYEAALAALDLAGVSAQLGRTSEVKRLAEEMLPIFRSRDVHREAIAALIVFQRAAADEHATLALVEELSTYLRKAASQPGLSFEPRR